LYLRKPIKHPAIDESTTNKNVSNKLRLIKNRSIKTRSDIPDTSPSRPSIRLKAFMVPTIKSRRIIVEGIIENSIVKKLIDENFGTRNSKSREAASA